MEYFLSIIIPVYNTKDYLTKCLNSILNQNVSGFEIILVDDGSTDNSKAICDQYAKKFKNVRVFHKQNGGLSSARNFGVKHAVGKWLWFIDSDDEITSDALKKVKRVLLLKKPDVLLFQFLYLFDNKKITNMRSEKIYLRDINRFQAMKNLKDPLFASYACNKIFKKNLFRNISFPINRNYEDMATTFKIYNYAKIFWITNDKFYIYRQRADSIQHNHSIKNIHDAALSSYELYEFLLKNYPSISRYFYQDTLISIFSYLNKIPIRSNDKDINNFKKLILNSSPFDNKFRIKLKLEIICFRWCKPMYYLACWFLKLKRKVNER